MNPNLIILVTMTIFSLTFFKCSPLATTKSNSVILTTKEYFDGNRDRKIKVYLWQKSDSISKKNKPMPLVLFSHGTEGSSANYTWFTVALAEKGFMVAGVDHYNNTWYRHTPIGAVSLWERPQDVTFILTKLLEDNSYSGMINKNKIAVAGHSAGGYTALALAGAIYDIELIRNYCDKHKSYLDCKIGKDVSIDFFKKILIRPEGIIETKE
jgi:predicted dienelactone hydrolase